MKAKFSSWYVLHSFSQDPFYLLLNGPFYDVSRKELLGDVRNKKERKWDIKCCLDINSVYQNDLSRFNIIFSSSQIRARVNIFHTSSQI